ncbi:MAG: ABC transporter permease [Dehalococcoidia bacterium]
MPFVLLILRNLLRQKIRTSLTVLGMSIGITAVVALGIITESALSATGELFTAGGSDFAIGRAGSSDLTLSVLTEDDLADVEAYDDIEHVTPVLMAFARVGSNPFFAQLGIHPADLDYFDAPLVEGRHLEEGATREVMLGDQAASDLGAEIGETVIMRREPDEAFTVVGIYNSGTTYLDGGALLSLDDLRELENTPDLYSLFFVRVQPGVAVQTFADQIEADHTALATLVEIDDIGEVDQGLEIMNAINLGITILAVFIGGIAVMNTMVMAVFERTREFGILRAVGWRTRRILQMVLGESLVLCLIASVLGSLVAVALTRLIVTLPTVRAFITPEYPLEVFLRGFAIGLTVALLGALYPAYRAASFSPAQAIRYE